ncbi:uncharacterized protein LOC143888590 [Tasmannia lanceolata]|uniref:uncharacterized protein LOC143888590 n=1 Tax=Tasmannia lanceolata TaxID=3420 RepID=UPI00406280C3
MTLRGASDGFMCKAFASLLRKTASEWYLRLEPDSIGSFHEFERKFMTQFANNRLRHDPVDALLALRHGKSETLRYFMLRFNAELSQLANIDIQIAVPHDDALVFQLIISNFDVGKILVDTGSSVNVLHLGAFEEMKLGEGRLGHAEYSIYGFSGTSVQISGKIDLPVTFGTYPLQRTIMTTFLVVDVPFTYNAIIGRPALRDLGAIVSTPHLKMKFPTLNGVGEVHGQQMVAGQCYYTSLKGSNAPMKNFAIGSEEPREQARTVRDEPIEELDSIPLSKDHLEKVVRISSSLTGHELLSFPDAFSGYNQIKMHELDVPKTTFITDQGLYCYTVMPFHLKNAGATYQRLVNKLFQKQIGRNVEVYVDDMLRGIEANPEKIQAILNMEAPTNVVEVQRLTGRLAALCHFMSKSAEKCQPFFKLLKNIQEFEWTPACQEAFDSLKQYLQAPPVLTKPEPYEELFLYLVVSSTAVSTVLVR